MRKRNADNSWQNQPRVDSANLDDLDGDITFRKVTN